LFVSSGDNSYVSLYIIDRVMITTDQLGDLLERKSALGRYL
jgi:hypothetical protein